MTPHEPPAREDAWMHELRNAVNAISMSIALSRRLMQEGDTARALESLARTELALQRVSTLMRRDGAAGRIGDVSPPQGD